MTKRPSAPQVKNIHKKSMQQLGGLNEEEKILSPKTAGLLFCTNFNYNATLL
jgi:hypothetical protein